MLGEDLDVLFCGINPSLYSAALGLHFARPGNRFWPALHLAGFTPRRFAPQEQHLLPGLGVGITNVVGRATASAVELRPEEMRDGAQALRLRILRVAPRFLAVLGIGAYRVGFDDRSAKMGPQEDGIGPTKVWVLPNPSGLNARYRLADLGAMFAELRAAVSAANGSRSSHRAFR